MKRLWILMLTLCVTALFCVSALGLGAEESNTDVWFVYSMKENEKGRPVFSFPPTYEYTSEGLLITPREQMESYTVQTDRAFSMDDGLYMEIKLKAASEVGMLIFHLWDQSGIMLGNYHCGSGWQGMLMPKDDSSQTAMSAFTWEVSSTADEGKAKIFGTVKFNALVNDDGTMTYCLEIKNGVLMINGTPMIGSQEILGYLREVRPDGCVHLGVTMSMTGRDDGTPITVTRFGTSKETATVPGALGDLPETGDGSVDTSAPDSTPTEEPSDETTAPAPSETDPPTEHPTDTLPPETPPRDEDTLPPEPDSDTDPSAPTETETEYDPYGDPPDMTTEEYDPPFGEKETETRREINDQAVNDFMGKMEGCTSAMGLGITSLASVLAAAYVCIRKKDRNE